MQRAAVNCRAALLGRQFHQCRRPRPHANMHHAVGKRARLFIARSSVHTVCLSSRVHQQSGTSVVMAVIFTHEHPFKIIGSCAGEQVGGRRLLLFVVFMWSLSTVLTPLIAPYHYLLLLTRVVLGSYFPYVRMIFHILRSWRGPWTANDLSSVR